MSADANLAAARARAALARQNLIESTQTLQERVAPSRLANDALASAKERGTEAIERAGREVQRRPAAFAAAGLGLLAFLARHRIVGLFRRKPKRGPITINATSRQALPGPKGDK